MPDLTSSKWWRVATSTGSAASSDCSSIRRTRQEDWRKAHGLVIERSTLTREQLKKTIVEILRDHEWVKKRQLVKDADDYYLDLGMDSIDEVEFFMDLEKEFSISIPEEDVEKLNTVGKTLDYLLPKLNENG